MADSETMQPSGLPWRVRGNYIVARRVTGFERDRVEELPILGARKEGGTWREEDAANLAAAAHAVNCYADLLAACEAVAEFDDCEDAADWKDAYGRLIRVCKAAVRAAKGGA